MIFKSLKLAGSVLAIAVGLLPVSAGAVDLPLDSPSCGLGPTNNCLVFEDFTVFSLALLNFQATGNDISAGQPFYVPSAPGQLHDSVVIATGPTGAVRDNQDLAPGEADDAYETPNNTGAFSFVMTAPDPLPDFTGDHDTLWDIKVDALNAILGDLDPVFFFNLNDTNTSGGGLEAQDILGWMRVTLWNTAGGSISFDLAGNNPCNALDPTCQTPTAGVDDLLPAGENWAHVHGQLCVSDDGAVVHFGACSGGEGNTVNQNLGQNAAAFALWSKDLADALDSGLWDVMSVDLRMSHIDNGYEQLFLFGVERGENEVPEPGTLALIGTGLLGYGLFRRRRKAA